ncbi:MAG: phosphatidylcholine/phosphatidylserine synthase [Planctomycetota bacterium]
MDNSKNHAAVIPNLITIGNAVCGFVALTMIAAAEIHDGILRPPAALRYAAWSILLGMIFDVFDGRVARMTGATSSLGAHLDSLADLVTFGLAPAGLIVTLNRVVAWQPAWQNVAWVFGLAYFLGALLRLARFNAESGPAEEDHLCFRGLPTPAAAGCVAGLVLVYFWLSDWRSWELRAIAETTPAVLDPYLQSIPKLLPFVGFFLGFIMVSSYLRYPHFASQLLARKQSFDTLVYLVFGVTLSVVMVEPILCLAFMGYVFWTPLSMLFSAARGRGREQSA